MLYGRSGGAGKSQMRSGLGSTRTLTQRDSPSHYSVGHCNNTHSDVLNRYTSLDSEAQTVHVMNYIFPRQFGLQNVFSSTAAGNGRANYLTNAIFREQEISQLIEKEQLRRPVPKGDQPHADHEEAGHTKLPKRLRGQARELIRRLRIRHSKCPYRQLLDYYCPDEVSLLLGTFDCILISFRLLVHGNLARLLLPRKGKQRTLGLDHQSRA